MARAAREVDGGFPVVYITGAAPQEWPVWGVPDSVLLTKPFAPEQLVSAISRLTSASADASGS